MPAPAPESVRLFHITDYTNLAAICVAGAVQAKNVVAASGGAYKNSAYQGAQGNRASKALPNPPGGTIHDYVPFYFAPRSPMLMAINNGRVEGCTDQTPMVHLETTIARSIENGSPHVFYDRNATLDYSEPYTELRDLDKVAWQLLTESPQLDGFCKYFHSVPSKPQYADRLERRMAEFLVKGHVRLTAFTRIGVVNAEMAVQVNAILTSAGVKLRAEVRPEWYFLPGQ